jgi:hypothetical protein
MTRALGYLDPLSSYFSTKPDRGWLDRSFEASASRR